MRIKLNNGRARLLMAMLVLFFVRVAAASNSQTLSLAGTWRFQLDANSEGVAGEWFKMSLPDQIELPGSCEQRGFGVKPAKPEELRLTHVMKYVGPAWYQREIVVPENWSGKRLELFLERCHWETTAWVDGQKLGTQNSLCTPHLYDLGKLSPGKHTLTVCVDNTYRLRIGTWAHAITEDTQGNWNGIIGRIELRATDPVWLRDVQVFPAKLKVSVGNQTGLPVEAKMFSQTFSIPVGGAEIELSFSPPDESWDEFRPKMRQLTVKLTAGKFSDAKQVAYGVRDLSTKDKQFTMNGRPILLRGPVDECVYPLTGYPPMNKAEWLRVLGICQSYGFNFMRFHSWCPPEAAFAAADDFGFMFQVELPVWTMDAPQFGEDPPRDQFIRDELRRILETYGNHPSFALMAMGNESGGTLNTLVQFGREKDARRLFRCENGETPADGDYFETGQRGILGPRTDWDRWSTPQGWISGSTVREGGTGPVVPTLSHEVGQWAMYPNFDEIQKFTGTLRANNYERYRNSLAVHHMLDQSEDFRQATGKFMVEIYKDEIEGSMRSWPYGGVEILEARDYPGQGTAIVGWLDAFWDSKGLIAPEKFREFCAPTVCLLRMPKRVLSADANFTATAQIAHYGPKAINLKPAWKITDDQGRVLAKGELPSQKIETGHVLSLGEISVALKNVAVPSRLSVTLSAGGTKNSWHVWVYPPMQPEPPKNIRIVHDFDQAARDALEAGEKVLLFSSPDEGVIFPKLVMFPSDSVRQLPPVQPGTNALPGSFLPVFWNARLFNQIGTLSLFCDPKHPALAEFPTENHSDWQWADLIGRFSAANSFGDAGAPGEYSHALAQCAGDVTNRCKVMILDETPPDFRPIVQVIDHYDRNAKLGVVFETRVGTGKLLVCSLDLDTDFTKRPAAQQLRRSLFDYVASDKFAPKQELSVEFLERLLTTAAVESAKTNSAPTEAGTPVQH